MGVAWLQDYSFEEPYELEAPHRGVRHCAGLPFRHAEPATTELTGIRPWSVAPFLGQVARGRKHVEASRPTLTHELLIGKVE